MVAPIRFLSGRQQQQKIGILNSTENDKVLEVVGRVGIGSTIFDAGYNLDVRGTANIEGPLTVESITITGAGNSFSGITTFTDTTNNVLGDPDTGAVQIDGGLGVNKNVTVGAGLSVLETAYIVGVSTFRDRVIFDSTNSIQIPVGTTAERDIVGVAITGQIRYNTELSSFEGYGPGGEWGSLGGVKDVDQDTYIIPELSAGSNENTLYFYTGGYLSGTISSTTGADLNVDLNVDGHIETDTLNVSGISTFGSNVDVNASVDISTNLTVDGLSDLDELNVAGLSTFGSNVDVNASVDISTNLTVDGLSDLDELNVAGVSTFGSDLDVNASVDISNNLVVDGLSDLDELNVAGISTFGSDIDVNASIDVSGHTELDTLNVSVATTTTSLTLSNAGVAVTAILDEDLFTSDRDDALATQQSIKAYVDAQITAQDLDFAGDTGTGAVDLDSQSLNIVGTANEIETVGSGTTLTIGLPDVIDITTSLTVGSATTITGSGIIAGIVTGTLDNTLTLNTSGSGISGSTTYNNSGASTFTVTSNATSANTPSTIVFRDGSGNFSAGTITANLTGVASTATKLETARDFSITGSFVTAPTISFDGTGNVALAATITPDSIALGTYTSGDYVQSITGTTNEIEVTGGSGESSTPQIGLPNDVTISNDLQVNRDVQINRNLNVSGNITIGGTTATLFTSTLQVEDPDIILGIRTDALGNDISNDSTANHGGIAIASTEGNPLVDLYVAGIETVPPTYKKIMWFKAGTFSGLGTDAWLSNYAIGIGSTQFPTGTRLAAGNVQITENDISVVRNIDASGYIQATGVSTFSDDVKLGNKILDSTDSAGTANYVLASGGPGAPWKWKLVTDVGAGILDAVFIRQDGSDVGTGTATTFDFYENFAVTQPSAGIASVRLADAINIGQLNVGVSTFSGNVDVNASVDISNNLVVDGLSDLDELNVAGIATFVSDVYVGASLYDNNDVNGNLNEVLVSTGAGVSWTTATSLESGQEILSTQASTPYYITASDVTSGVSTAGFIDTDIVINGGNVGIGTDNPGTRLEISAPTSAGAISNALSLTQTGTGSGTGTRLLIGYDTAIGTYGSIEGFYDGTGTSLTFGTSVNAGISQVTERLRITGAGLVGIGSTQPTQKLDVNGNIAINQTTVIGSETASLSTVTETAIHTGLSASTYRSVEYNIQATQGTNFHVTKILALHNGTTAYHNEYGTIFNNSSVATFNVDVSGGNIRLLATGASASQTDYVINFTATKL